MHWHAFQFVCSQMYSEGIKVTTVCPSSVKTGICRKSIVGTTTQDDDRDITALLALFKKGALSPERYGVHDSLS